MKPIASAVGGISSAQYRLLGKLRDRFPGVNLHAYTATATEQVRTDIATQLHQRQPRILVGDFDRPNLTYRVVPRQELRRQVREVIDRFTGQAGIIYCISRRQVEELNLFLVQSGYRSVAYHAGLDHDRRQAAQDDFLNERAQIVVATVAFGMGIDKPNGGCDSRLRDEIDRELPAGNGPGRSRWAPVGMSPVLRQPGFCHLEENAGRPADGSPGDGNQATQLKSLFCHGMTCRHRSLVEYFGQSYERDNCRACDVCLQEMQEMSDALVISQKILSCVVRVEERFGGDYVASVLAGSREQRVLENGHDRLSTYGLLGEHAKKEIRQWLDQLESQQLLERRGEYGTLSVTAKGRRVFKGEFVPRLLQPRVNKPVSRNQRVELSELETLLFEELRKLRRDIAAEKNVAPFVIFGDVTLIDLSSRRPTCKENFLHIHGVGQRKCDEYAARFIEVIIAQTELLELPRDRNFDPLQAPGVVESMSGSTPDEAPTKNIPRAASEMFAAGASLEEVAERMQRAQSTVAQYLVDYIERECLVSSTPWVDEDVFQQVSLAALEVDSDRLKPLHEALLGKISYDEIRIVKACLKNMEARG
ncbi:MAG: RQC domain-containing protein [Planctomycetaceae bacterium]